MDEEGTVPNFPGARATWTAVLLVAALLAVCSAGEAASTQSADILVRIAPDAKVVPARSQDGYTISITNTTAQDLAIDAVRFLLPGHGTQQLRRYGGEIYGEPQQSRDVSPAFDYILGSTNGLTNADPVQVERWLTWDGDSIAANSTATLHFGVTTSLAPAYYVSGATATVSGGTTVLGTAKGAVVQVLSAEQFSMELTAEPTVVHVGDRIDYRGTVTNNSDQTVTVIRTKVSAIGWASFISGSTTGVLSGDPIQESNIWRWNQVFTIAPHSGVEFGFAVQAVLAGLHNVKGRAFLETALPDGQAFAGTGPAAYVKVLD